MTTPELLDFYKSILDEPEDLAKPPLNFRMIVADPAGMGPKGGIVVDQKRAPGQLGKLQFAQTSHKVWNIETSNIGRFHFAELRSKTPPDFLRIDGNTINMTPDAQLTEIIFSRSLDGSWKVVPHSQVSLYPQLTYSDMATFSTAKIRFGTVWRSAWAFGCFAPHKRPFLDTSRDLRIWKFFIHR